jgi:hypothetical protein
VSDARLVGGTLVALAVLGLPLARAHRGSTGRGLSEPTLWLPASAGVTRPPALLPFAAMTDIRPQDRRPQRIAVVPGDGIGKDVTVEAVKVLQAATERFALPIELEHFPWSADHYLATGVTMPPISSSAGAPTMRRSSWAPSAIRACPTTSTPRTSCSARVSGSTSTSISAR